MSDQTPSEKKPVTAAEMASRPKLCLLEQTPDSLREWFGQQDLEPYRADQVLQWVYTKYVPDVERMTNLPKPLRETLKDGLEIFRGRLVEQTRSDDGVIKLLLEFPDGADTECVLIPAQRRRTACLSTQSGCPVGCVFCASGTDGLRRSLTAGEIVEQLLRLQLAGGCEERITHVVVMGMGEPLANFDATLQAIYTINEKWGAGIGARHITVSTVGIPDRIRQLAEHNLQINLAISLHAPTDPLRRQLVPWAAHFRLKAILEAAQYYFEITGREITIEYVLIKDVNDHLTQASQLAKLAKKIRCTVNLIPYNPVEGLPYERPSTEKVHAFQRALRKAHVPARVRRSRGTGVQAACGQLRRRVREK